MQYIKKIISWGLVFGIATALISVPQSFTKKKKSGPCVTECCDQGVDVLSYSADIVQTIGILQQQLVKISRQMIENDKKCYLISANKQELQNYFDRTQQCKEQLISLHKELRSYTDYLSAMH